MNYRQQSSSEPGQRTDVQDRLGEAPVRRTIHRWRRLGPVNPMEETTSTSRADTRSETTSASREERRPDRGSITGVDWLIAAGTNFSSTTALRFADLEGLPSNNTMGPVNARPLQDVRLNHDEGNREERPGRFLTTRPPIGQHAKMFRQVATPPSHVKERTYRNK